MMGCGKMTIKTREEYKPDTWWTDFGHSALNGDKLWLCVDGSIWVANRGEMGSNQYTHRENFGHKIPRGSAISNYWKGSYDAKYKIITTSRPCGSTVSEFKSGVPEALQVLLHQEFPDAELIVDF